jgi:hypothetical protein
MNIESEESTMNSESQSLKVVAGVFAALATVADIAHSQQIPTVPNGRRSHCPAVGPMPKA